MSEAGISQHLIQFGKYAPVLGYALNGLFLELALSLRRIIAQMVGLDMAINDALVA